MIDTITKIIAQHLDVDVKDVTPFANIYNDLGADQLDELEILMIIEEEFEVDIPDQDFEVVQDYINAVKEAQNNA